VHKCATPSSLMQHEHSVWHETFDSSFAVTAASHPLHFPYHFIPHPTNIYLLLRCEPLSKFCFREQAAANISKSHN
jgi:hypothetical protein